MPSPGAAPELPPTLSVPELAALVDGPRIGDARAISLALKELVARGVLEFVTMREPSWGWFGHVGEYALIPGKAYHAALRRPLQAVLEVYEQLEPKTDVNGHPGVHVNTLALAMFKRYHKRTFFPLRTHVYVQQEVLPALAAHGLGWPSRTLTSHGHAVKAEWRAWLDRIDDVLRAHARSHGVVDTTEAVDIALSVIDDEVRHCWKLVFQDA